MADTLHLPSSSEINSHDVTRADMNSAAPEDEELVPSRQRDEIFWTELEIRRLGNLVAEGIHARRYVGDNDTSEEERKLMRQYIEAMKRKSMRVLHRAELYASSGHAAWPGIDPTITDPVSLAEEYVRVVENYEAVLSEEESRARRARHDASKPLHSSNDPTSSKGANDQSAGGDDWETADDVAYKEALQREQNLTVNSKDARNELFAADTEGIRRRRGAAASSSNAASYSKEEEELMARHQPVQDELTSNLVDLVGQLKESITANNDKISKDNRVLDETEDAIDKNLSAISKQGTDLRAYTKSASVSWWVILVAAAVACLVFVMVFILLRVPL